MKSRIKWLKWINAAAFLAMVVINVLANLLPLGGNTTGEVSAKYPNLLTPSPYTFSIWGVIYLLMAIFVLFQCELLGDHFAGSAMRIKIGPLFFISCILNTAWIVCWHFSDIFASTVLIILLFLVLLVIRSKVEPQISASFIGDISVYGFELYQGWLTVAVIVNICVFLVSLNWNHFGLPEQIWAIAILLFGTLIGSAYTFIKKEYFSTIAVIWAYLGILVRHIVPGKGEPVYPFIVATTVVSIIFMIIMIAISLAPTTTSGLNSSSTSK